MYRCKLNNQPKDKCPHFLLRIKRNKLKHIKEEIYFRFSAEFIFPSFTTKKEYHSNLKEIESGNQNAKRMKTGNLNSNQKKVWKFNCKSEK